MGIFFFFLINKYIEKVRWRRRRRRWYLVVGLLKRVGLSVLREGEKAGDEPGPHVKHLLRNLIFCTFGS